jgi:SAM-dependent methyltransferase
MIPAMSAPPPTEPRSCPACGGEDVVPTSRFLPLRYRVCASCGFLTPASPPAEDPSFFTAYGGSGPYTSAEAQRRYEAAARIRVVDRFTSPGRLLEVGSAGGFFLDEARRAGFDVLGVEPSNEMAEYARASFDVPVRTAAIEEAGLPTDSFEVACAWHVLEHLPEPLAGLEAVGRALVPGGRFFAEVPNVASRRARREGARWLHLDPAHHLGAFTPDSARALFVRAGFAIIHAETVPRSAYLRTLGRRVAAGAHLLAATHTWPSRSHHSKHELLRLVARSRRS